MSFSWVQKAPIAMRYRRKSYFLAYFSHLTDQTQDRDTYDSILKTLDRVLSHRTIKNEFQLGTEGTYLNMIQKKNNYSSKSISKTLDPMLLHKTDYKTIKNEFLLGTEDTYINEVQKNPFLAKISNLT